MLKNIIQDKTKRVFCYLRGVHHFDLFYNIFKENPDVEFYFHSNYIPVDFYRRSKLYELPNVYFTADIKKFKYKLNLFGAFITTDAQATAPHAYSLEIIHFFNKLGVPVFELQHGLFQLGLHYYDVPHKEIFHDDSFCTETFADHVLAYYPENAAASSTVIGYPAYDHLPEPYEGEYTLILSNLHWETYDKEEKYQFYKMMMELAVENPKQTYIWKMHHGEQVNPICNSMIKSLFEIYPHARKNIIFYHENEFLSKSSVTELIQKSREVISTISTVLLDCDMCNKKTATYCCPTVECLINRMKNPQSFTCLEELKEVLGQEKKHFSTGLLYKYDNKAFRKTLDKLYQPTKLSKSEFLELVLEFKK